MPLTYISKKDCPRNYGVELSMEILLKKSHFLIALCGFSLCGFPWQMAMSLTTEAARSLLFSVMGSQQTQPGSLSETESPVSLCRFGSNRRHRGLPVSLRESRVLCLAVVLTQDGCQTDSPCPSSPACSSSQLWRCLQQRRGRLWCFWSWPQLCKASCPPGHFSSELWSWEEEGGRLRLLWGVLQHISTNWNKRGKGIAVVLVISSGTENTVSGIDLLHLLWMKDRRGHHQKVLFSWSRKFTLKPEMGLSARMEISLLSN